MNTRVLTVCRLTLAFAYAYQGLVPKLLGPHADELAMILTLGLTHTRAVQFSYAAGVAELLLAGALVALPERRWPYQVTLILMPTLLLSVAWAAPQLLVAAFNPVVLNVVMAALAYVALLELRSRER